MDTFKRQGTIRGIPEKVEEHRTIPFILSTFERDRHKTVLNQHNWKLDNYERNPIVGYQHELYGNSLMGSNPDTLIGMGKNIKTEGDGNRKILTGDAKFEPREINLLAEKVFRKILFGSLRAVSVGFAEIGIGKFGTGDQARGKENETYYFEGQELLEFSIVNIGSNPKAGKRFSMSARALPRAALVYVLSELGQKYSMSQIEMLSIEDLLTLLAGRDIDIKSNDPNKVRKLLQNKGAIKDQIQIIEGQRKAFRDASNKFPLIKSEADYVRFSEYLRLLNN